MLPPWDPMDCSPPGSSVHGISQARILEWVAMPSSRGSSDPGIEPTSPALVGGFFTTKPTGRPMLLVTVSVNTLWEMEPFFSLGICDSPRTLLSISSILMLSSLLGKTNMHLSLLVPGDNRATEAAGIWTCYVIKVRLTLDSPTEAPKWHLFQSS